MKIIVTRKEDPKPTPEQLAAANAEAKRFALNRHLIFGEDAHVGNRLPKYVDEKGNIVTSDYTNVPKSQILNTPPSYVKQLEWDDKANLPYFIDEKSGDLQYVNKDWFYTDRFNPKRGQYSLLAGSMRPNNLIPTK